MCWFVRIDGLYEVLHIAGSVLFEAVGFGGLAATMNMNLCPAATASFFTSRSFCEGGGDVVGVVTPLVGGVAQAFHDDRVVELRVQLGVQEVEGKDREEQVEVERERRVKEVRSWMTMEMFMTRLRT